MGAFGAKPLDLQVMALYGKPGVVGKLGNQIINRAGSKFHDPSASGTDEMVPVTGGSHDISRMPSGMKEPRCQIEASQDFERTIDGSAANRGSECNDLLGGESPILIQYMFDDRSSRTGYLVSVLRKRVQHLRNVRLCPICGGSCS